MLEVKQEVEGLAHEAQEFIEAKVESIKLEAAEKAVEFTSSISAWILVFMLGLISFLSGSVLVGVIISQALESYLLGFTIVFGFYVLLTIAIVIFRKQTVIPFVQNKMYKSILKSYDSNGKVKKQY